MEYKEYDIEMSNTSYGIFKDGERVSELHLASLRVVKRLIDKFLVKEEVPFFEIEKDVPIPKRVKCKAESTTESLRAVMMKMVKGDSVFLPDKKCYNAAKNATKNCPTLDINRFKMFSENGGYRLFKTA